MRDNNVDKGVERTARQPLLAPVAKPNEYKSEKDTAKLCAQLCSAYVCVSGRGEKKKDTEGESKQEGVRTG